MKIRNFAPSEFTMDEKDCYGMMNCIFLVRLECFRMIIDKKMIVTSSYRDINKNRDVGGLSDSFHLEGQAIDFEINSGDPLVKMPGYILILKDAANKAGLQIVKFGTYYHLEWDDRSEF